MKNDKQLLRKLKCGDKKAFEAIYHHYADRVFSLVKSFHISTEDAQEIVQDVFLKIWEKRADIKENQSFKAYLLVIAKNMLLNKLKRKTYEVTFKHYIKKFSKNFDNSTEDYIIYDDLVAHANHLIDQMPNNRKHILLLKREQGLTNKEISEQLNISKRTVDNNLYKANKTLKSFLSKDVMLFIAIMGLSFYFK